MPCRVRFMASGHPPVWLPRNSNLSEHLTVQNSPVLFGCRTGICGTCVARVDGDIPPPNDEERDTLESIAPGDPRARLLCQLDLTADIDITVITVE
jgi:ferredoxin